MSDDATSDDSQDEGQADKAEKFTKRQLKEPMESLSSALGQLCVNLNNPKKNSLFLDKIMTKYNGIARMTSHGGQLQLIHQDGDDNDASSNDDDESHNADDGSSQGSLSTSDSRKMTAVMVVMQNPRKVAMEPKRVTEHRKQHWMTRSRVTRTLLNISIHWKETGLFVVG